MARSRLTLWRLVLTIAACAGLLDGLGLPITVPLSGTVMAVNGMVATVAPLATQAGLRILQQSGNAFDAAVAVSAVTAITDTPSHAGLGGTGYLSGTDLVHERPFSASSAKALAQKGHSLVEPTERLGMLNDVKIYPRSGVLSAGADPRREGHAAGR